MTILQTIKAWIMQIRLLLQQDKKKATPKKNMKVKTEDPQTDYYSSDDHSSDSGEESDSLN